MARFLILGSESRLWIKATTNMFAINGTATGLSGYVDAEVSGSKILLNPMPSMRLVVPIANLDSGNEAQDREMRNMIGSQRYPNLTAELRHIKELPQPERYAMRGDITVRGSTQTYDAEGTIKVAGGRITVEAEQRMDIRKFALVPPRIPMLQIDPEFTVRMRLVAALDSK